MNGELLEQLSGIVGGANMVPGATVRAEIPAWQTHQPCHARVLVRPANTAEVSAVLAACHAACQPVVTYGGVTNLVQACATTEQDLVLSLSRMAQIEEVDATAQTMTAQAGVTLKHAQAAADDAGLFYPVDIGARDNCTLGGNVATNAGGTRVIRYGMTRDSVLGLEAVLADGTVLSSMNRFIKNNSGFDLKHLFIGTEGVLGVVTRVVMRLSVKPDSHNVALLACNSYADVVGVLSGARKLLGANLCGFEVMWNSFYSRVTKPLGPRAAPIPPDYPYYLIVESMGTSPARDDDAFAAAMAQLFASERVVDGVMAKSGQERAAIWAIRHEVEWIVSGAQNFDVSLRIADVDAYVTGVASAIVSRVPGAVVAAFGHLGDNNIHVSVVADVDQANAAYIEEQIYGHLQHYGGAISAEHGIGLDKRRWLRHCRTGPEIEAMRLLKRSFDTHDILNRGKVVGDTLDVDTGSVPG